MVVIDSRAALLIFVKQVTHFINCQWGFFLNFKLGDRLID